MADDKPTLSETILNSINTAEFGYHELSEAEATQILCAVIDWLQDRGVDLVEIMTIQRP